MSERLSDLQVYQHLTRSADELDQLASQAVSIIGQTALQTAAKTVRGMATAVYEHSLAQDGGH